MQQGSDHHITIVTVKDDIPESVDYVCFVTVVFDRSCISVPVKRKHTILFQTSI